MEYKDYYKTLGVAKEADATDIQRAYRKLARQFHPDVNKDPAAEARFKEIGEAYEVLKDEEKRSRYDQYGAAWQQVRTGGAPPPGWEGIRFHVDGAERFDFGGGASDFSPFFDMLFGGAARGFPGGGQAGSWRPPYRGRNRKAALPLSLEDIAAGGPQEFQFLDRSTGQTRRLQVTVPPGVLPGQSIRLAGQGGKGVGAPDGDLLLEVEAQPHPLFRRQGRDLHCRLPVAPWTAALGGKVRIPTLAGHAEARLPPGTSTGRKVRLRGRGLPDPKGRDGDLLAEVQVAVPARLTAQEKALFEQLRETSDFAPSGDRSETTASRTNAPKGFSRNEAAPDAGRNARRAS